MYEQRKQLNEHIAKYETPVDPYAELKEAFAAGKRIAWYPAIGGLEFLREPAWSVSADRYKIVEDDETDNCEIAMFGLIFRTEFTKCALTGKITAEVLK